MEEEDYSSENPFNQEVVRLSHKHVPRLSSHSEAAIESQIDLTSQPADTDREDP